MKNISTKLRIGFGIIVLVLLAANSGTANPDRMGTMQLTDDILRSRVAFAVVEEEIARHLNLGVLTAWDFQKLHGPVLLEIRTEIHFQLRQAFGRIVNTVDFGAALGSGSSSHSPSTPQVNKPILHKRASEIIRDFIAQQHISVIIMSNAPIGIGEVAAIRRLRGEVRYTYKIINGASVVIPIRNLAALIRRPFITEIWPNAKGNLELNDSVEQIGADKVHNPPNAPEPEDRGLGVTGEGVRVAVVDGGIDVTHPEFGGRIDAVRGDIKIAIARGTDLEHGTHVAGIIGAADDNTGVTGVAPRVQFLDARIFFGSALDDLFNKLGFGYADAISAIEWAVENNPDVINMSMGWDTWQIGRDGKDPMSELIDRIVDDGIVFVTAAGNEGSQRASGDVTSQRITETHEFTVEWGFDLFGSTLPVGISSVTLVWDPTSPNNDLDLTILDASNNEIASSRLHLHLHNSTKRGTSVYERVIIPRIGSKSEESYTLRVEAWNIQGLQDYEVWVSENAEISDGDPEGTVTVPGYSEKVITVGAALYTATDITTFSSQGTSQTNSIKPEVIAPGHGIESTIGGGGTKRKSGTSMAAPHVAGVAALILDAVGKNNHGEWNFSSHAVKAAIVRSADRWPFSVPGTPDNTYGTGLVKADNIIFGGTVPPDGIKRFEINPRLTGQSYGGNVLAAGAYLTVAISWESAQDNLDIALVDASTGRKIQESNLVSSNYEKVGTSPRLGDSYYLDVVNRSKRNVTFTGATTHPLGERPSPDLRVIFPSVDKEVLAPGERFEFSATVINTGKEEAHFTDLRYYRSSDAFITDSEEIGDDRVKTLNLGLTSPEIINLRAPDAPGTYYYRACVDSVQGETDMGNNCSEAVSITVETVETSVPDLVVESVEVDKEVLAPSERFKLAAIVENRGTHASGSTALRYYRSSDAVISTSDTEVGDDDRIVGLNPDKRDANFTNLRAPEVPGTYYYGVCVDSVDGETDTGNNCSEAISITVEAAQTPAPDLIVESLTVDDRTIGPGNTIAPGDRFQLEVVLRNQGTVATTNRADLDYYYSLDTTLTGTGNDVRASGDPINPLAPDATDDLTQYITAPAEPGVYYYGVCISDVEGEHDLANNCSSVDQVIRITVDPNASVVDGVDIYIPEIRFKLQDTTKVEEAVLLPGDRFRIYLTVGNRGKLDDDYVRRRVYFLFSPDAHIEGRRKGNEEDIDRIYLRTLRAGRTKFMQSPLIEVPETPGIYYYGAEIDPGSSESNIGNDGNNVSAAATLIVNKVPRTRNNFSPQSLTMGTPVSVDLDTYFADEENLTYTAVLVPATPQVVALNVSGTTLELTPQQAGSARVKVTAKDPYWSAEDPRWQTEQEFEVTVTQPHNLAVESVRASKTTVKPGENFYLIPLIHNQGKAASTTVIRHYLSTDETISAADTEVDTTTITLSRGLNEVLTQLTAPDTPGTYYYGVCIDAVEGESDTTHTCSGAIAITVKGADLIIDGTPQVSKTTLLPGETFQFNTSVWNRGSATSDATTLRYYLSTDETISIEDTAVANGRVNPLSGRGASANRRRAMLSKTLTAPDTPGTYYYGVCVDAVPGDPDTDNNCSEAIAITVEAPPEPVVSQGPDIVEVEGPDLIISMARVDASTIKLSEGVRLHITLTNQGTSGAPSTTIRWYRSLDATISAADTELRAVPVGPLGAGKSYTTWALLPGATSVGVYYYGACLDGVESEFDTSNNCSAAIEITVERQGDTKPLLVPIGTISMQELDVGGAPVVLNVSGNFFGKVETWTVSSSQPSVVTTSLSGSEVTLTPVSEGWAAVTIQASSGDLRATQIFYASVGGVAVPEREFEVLIPDANLRAAVRSALELAEGDLLTQQRMLTLRTLSASGASISNLTGLEYARGLTSLSLGTNQIRDLTPLENLWSLTDLVLSKNQEIVDFTPLENLRSLRHLDLDNNRIVDLTPLENLRSLRHLDLDNNRIVDLTPLENLTNLTDLSLIGNQIRDVSPLEGLTSLQKLWIAQNPIADLAPLRRLKEKNPSLFIDIDINTGEVPEPEVLIPDVNLRAAVRAALGLAEGDTLTQQQMQRLTTLHASDSGITDLAGLEHATNLRQLWLFENLISDISPLANLISIEDISLTSNPISDMRPLANLTTLTILHIGGSGITDLSPLANLRSLTELWLFENQITDLSPLANLTALTVLDISSNNISDIGPLASLTALRHLSILYLTSLTDFTPLEELTTLQSLVFTDDMTVDENSLDIIFNNNPGLQNDGITIVAAAPGLLLRVEPSAPVLPDETGLLPNYPNPFNPETWIPYQLATDADVILTIYDVRGIMVRRLALGHQPAGFYRSRGRAAHWDGRNQLGEKVASGLYFYTFTAGDFTATQKLLIRK